MTKGEETAAKFREYCESCDMQQRKYRHEASRAYIWEEYRYDIGASEDYLQNGVDNE